MKPITNLPFEIFFKIVTFAIADLPELLKIPEIHHLLHPVTYLVQDDPENCNNIYDLVTIPLDEYNQASETSQQFVLLYIQTRYPVNAIPINPKFIKSPNVGHYFEFYPESESYRSNFHFTGFGWDRLLLSLAKSIGSVFMDMGRCRVVFENWSLSDILKFSNVENVEGLRMEKCRSGYSGYDVNRLQLHCTSIQRLEMDNCQLDLMLTLLQSCTTLDTLCVSSISPSHNSDILMPYINNNASLTSLDLKGYPIISDLNLPNLKIATIDPPPLADVDCYHPHHGLPNKVFISNFCAPKLERLTTELLGEFPRLLAINVPESTEFSMSGFLSSQPPLDVDTRQYLTRVQRLRQAAEIPAPFTFLDENFPNIKLLSVDHLPREESGEELIVTLPLVETLEIESEYVYRPITYKTFPNLQELILKVESTPFDNHVDSFFFGNIDDIIPEVPKLVIHVTEDTSENEECYDRIIDYFDDAHGEVWMTESFSLLNFPLSVIDEMFKMGCCIQNLKYLSIKLIDDNDAVEFQNEEEDGPLSSLESLSIDAKVKTLSLNSFTNLKYLNITGEVESILLHGCSSLENISFKGDNRTYKAKQIHSDPLPHLNTLFIEESSRVKGGPVLSVVDFNSAMVDITVAKI